VIGELLLRFARKRPWNDNLDCMKRVPPPSLRDIQHVIQGRRVAFGGAAYESFSRCTENSAFSRVEESIHQDFYDGLIVADHARAFARDFSISAPLQFSWNSRSSSESSTIIGWPLHA
jgi:hypothetical protein